MCIRVHTDHKWSAPKLKQKLEWGFSFRPFGPGAHSLVYVKVDALYPKENGVYVKESSEIAQFNGVFAQKTAKNAQKWLKIADFGLKSAKFSDFSRNLVIF